MLIVSEKKPEEKYEELPGIQAEDLRELAETVGELEEKLLIAWLEMKDKKRNAS